MSESFMVEMWATGVHVNPELRADATRFPDYLNNLVSVALEDCVRQGHKVVRPPETSWHEPNPFGATEVERDWPLLVIRIPVLGVKVER